MHDLQYPHHSKTKKNRFIKKNVFLGIYNAKYGNNYSHYNYSLIIIRIILFKWRKTSLGQGPLKSF